MGKIKTVGKFAASSLTTTAVDFLLFTLLFALLKERVPATSELIATVVARIASSLLNFSLNNRFVFENGGSKKRAFIRYYCLCIPQMLASAGLVTLINRLFDNSATLATTAIKVLVDLFLFVVSFFIQRKWVFAQKKDK